MLGFTLMTRVKFNPLERIYTNSNFSWLN